MITNIKKTYCYNYKGFYFEINRNFRNDNFLQKIKDNNETFLSYIVPPKTVFLSIKAAKNIATGKCFKRLNYIKGVGYIDSKGNPNYDGSEGSFSSYAITGYDYEKMGNIHVDTNFLKD